MSIVIDSSVSLSWVFADETTPETETLLDLVRDEGGLVPSLWEYEVSNALLVAMRRGRLSQADAGRIMTLLRSINLRVVQTLLDMKQVFSLAHAHGLSVYDAAYLDLAISHDAPLATLDSALAQAAATAGVEVLPHVS